jgi:VWFA-related protein
MALVLAGGQVQQPTFRAESAVVSVPTLVLDQNDEPVFGLTAADFVIEDDGIPQDVAADETVDDTPVSIVVAVQVGRTAPAEFPRIRALATMLESVMARGNTRVSVVKFDSQVTQANDFTTETSEVSASLKKLRPGDNGAAILHAIRYSVLLLEGEPQARRRVLLLVSETRDHGNQIVDLSEVLRDIASSNTLVYSLAFGPALSNVLDDLRGNLEPDPATVTSLRPDVKVLNLANVATKLGELARQGMRKNVSKAVARLTGGEYELFKSENSFQSDMNTFTNHLYSRYLLYFTPREPQPGLHLLTVRLRNSGTLKVISRPTYWAQNRMR